MLPSSAKMVSLYNVSPLVLSMSVLCLMSNGGYGQDTVFPGIITFGDSGNDFGNNNHLPTNFKANYPPYGRDFVNHTHSGRFSNGKLAVDYTAEALGFDRSPPAYFSPEASGKNLLIGASFASAGAGYDHKASISNHAIPLAMQLEHFKEYNFKLAKVAGRNKSATIIRDALYILSAGTSDFLQNYYFDPSIRRAYTFDRYSSFLVCSFSSFVKELYGLGARKIGVLSLPPLGCLPAAKSLLGSHGRGCNSTLNNNAKHFNEKLNEAAAVLRKQLPGLKLVIFDIFQPIHDLVASPSQYGFVEATRSCCATGTTGKASVLCDIKSKKKTCSNDTSYVFWDAVHLSEAANRIIADTLLVQGVSLV